MNQLSWLHKYVNELYEKSILENFFEIQIKSLEQNVATIAIQIDEKHSNYYGFVHGGTFASLADVAMGLACATIGKQVVTIDMNINFIKNTPTGSTITAVGKVTNSGNTIIRAEAEVWGEEQQLLVKASANFFIIGDFKENDNISN